MRKISMIIVLAVLVLGVLAVAAQEEDEPVRGEYDGIVEAPEFPTGLDWLNVPAPLTLDDLNGKIVLLDFWTYGCINCIHMIPVLAQLEAKYAEELVVIGVHSAKFDNEGRTDNIRQIVQRYELHHPVINDSNFDVWNTYRAYGVNAWPTFVIIDPNGKILAVQPGEVPFDAFDRVISGMVDYFDEQLNREPLDIEMEARATTALAFPGKVLVDEATNRLLITDTNHHRIIIADLLTYEVLDVIGSGQEGQNNGSFDEATFNQPQGLTLDGNMLYIADTKNHMIRAADLGERTVTTVAGTGEQAAFRAPGGPTDIAPISSPWDVEMGDNGVLYVAMAGPHQIWRLDLVAEMIEPFIGSGREGLVDDNFAQSELAQPSGLAYVDGRLYFADSESSSIRVADIRDQSVRTLAGPTEGTVPNAPQRLFTFGDEDGPVGTSRLQHPLGVTVAADGSIYTADTYNSKIKRINPETTVIETLFGQDSDTGGYRDGPADVAEFDEPGGLDYANGRLYVADTNNHAIRVIDLDSGEVSTITFPNPDMLQIGERPTVIGGNAALGEMVTLDPQTVGAGDGEIVLTITLPEGYKLNDLAPFTAEWVVSGDAVAITDDNLRQSIIEPDIPVRVPVRFNAGEDLLHGDITIYYCEAVNESLCFIDQVSIDVPVIVSGDGGGDIIIEREVVPPDVGL